MQKKIQLNALILTILFLVTNSYAQDLNRKDLISQLKADSESIFVINGIAFTHSDSLKLEAKLNKIKKNKIAEISILKNEGKTSHQKNDIIIINHATNLSKSIIKTKLKEIIPKFKDEYNGFSQHIFTDAKDPVLYLNGNKIHHTEAKKILNKLKLKNIVYIYFSQANQSEEYHGQNAKNGIVIIWTNEMFVE